MPYILGWFLGVPLIVLVLLYLLFHWCTPCRPVRITVAWQTAGRAPALYEWSNAQVPDTAPAFKSW